MTDTPKPEKKLPEIPQLQREDMSHVKVSGQVWKNRHFKDVNALGTEFSGCDFSYSVIERGYFRNATFRNCNFTGAKFIDCNFARANLFGCDLSYARFTKCEIEIKEFLAALPMEPNIRQGNLRNLRANANETGDHASLRLIVLDEIESTKLHNRRALTGADSYYKSKYSSVLSKVQSGWNWLRLTISGFVWGNGERPVNILFSAVFFLLALTLINFWAILPKMTWEQTGHGWFILKYTLSLFFDVFPEEKFRGFLVVDYIISAMRYIYVGLFISVMFKTISHR